jgi:hypothetical protein
MNSRHGQKTMEAQKEAALGSRSTLAATSVDRWRSGWPGWDTFQLLGECSTIVRMFNYGRMFMYCVQFLKITLAAHFWLLFSRYMLRIRFGPKTGWATFWATLKTGWATFWATFFASSSGRPGDDQPLEVFSCSWKALFLSGLRPGGQ